MCFVLVVHCSASLSAESFPEISQCPRIQCKNVSTLFWLGSLFFVALHLRDGLDYCDPVLLICVIVHGYVLLFPKVGLRCVSFASILRY